MSRPAPRAADAVSESLESSPASDPRIVVRDIACAERLAGVEPAILRRVYAGRGVVDPSELDYALSGLPHFREFKDIDAAVALLTAAIDAGRRITIVGDFDADGATSTALALAILGAFGARVDYFIPHRIHHGYGLSPRVIDALGPAAAESLILTVDNGIAAHAGVAAARAAGWQVLICDHHLPGDRLPAADAIVNPNQPGCRFPGKALAGVGVTFYLMAALRAARAATPEADVALPRMGDCLDLVALGTIADIVALDHVNRTLVSQGLRRIRAGRARPGIIALAHAAGRDDSRLDSDDIGFALAPRLNAAGRLEDMRIGVECLRAADAASAREFAETLSSLNQRRRAVQQRMQDQAERALAAVPAQAREAEAITVYREDWHEGVVGLIAARLRERWHRPVIAFAPGEHGLIKGSARSIPGVHIRDVLAAVDADAPGLIAQFGGHAQAAGLSIEPTALDRFDSAFTRAVAARMTPALRARDYVTDGELADDEHALETALALRRGGPWGSGFEAPSFHGRYRVLEQRVVGSGHLKLVVRAAAGRTPIEAMVFQRDRTLDEDRYYRFVFQLKVNEFRGVRRANLIVEWLSPDP